MNFEGQQMLHRVADWIESHPEQYDQTTWLDSDTYLPGDDNGGGKDYNACGTTACIAGWTCQFFAKDNGLSNGWQLAYFNFLEEEFDEEGVRWLKVKKVEAGNGDGYPASAEKILDLDEDEASRLFSANWKPRQGMTVPEALRKIAEGASVEEVSWDWDLDEDGYPLPQYEDEPCNCESCAAWREYHGE